MRENGKPREYIEIRKPKTHPSHFFLLEHLLYESTSGGVRRTSLPLSLEIVATDISLCDNEGAM